MSEKCACRIEVNGLVDLDSEKKIKMCPVHAAAFKMLAALKETREALAAACRVAARLNFVDELLAESRAAGVKDGVGTRGSAAIRLAEKGTP